MPLAGLKITEKKTEGIPSLQGEGWLCEKAGPFFYLFAPGKLFK